MLVYGKNVLLDMDPKKIRKVYLSNRKRDFQLIDYLKEHHLRFEFVPLERINKMVEGNHQGIVVEVDEYSYAPLSSCFDESLVVILDHLEDPHNLGAIIRTAEACGVHSIVIPKDRSTRINDTVMKVSAGALDRVNVIMVTNISLAIQTLQKEGFFVYASCMDGKNYKNISYHSKSALVVGNEGKGISPLVRKSSDELVTIPMKGAINSLNASVAFGILIFQMMEVQDGIS